MDVQSPEVKQYLFLLTDPRRKAALRNGEEGHGRGEEQGLETGGRTVPLPKDPVAGCHPLGYGSLAELAQVWLAPCFPTFEENGRN